jgi:hypothetical protein
MCRLGWLLVAVCIVLILTSTLAAPPTAHHRMPSAPAPQRSQPALHHEAPPVPTGM